MPTLLITFIYSPNPFFFEGVGEAPKLMISCILKVGTVKPILHFARVKTIYEVYYHEGVTGAAVNRCEREMCDGRYGYKQGFSTSKN